MTAVQRNSPDYWNAVRDASEYLLLRPATFTTVPTFRGRKTVSEVFSWPGSAEGEMRSHHVELARFRDYRLLGLGRVAVSHRLSVATHLGGEIGVTTMVVDIGGQRIGQASFQTVGANPGPEPEHPDALFSRVRAAGDETPLEVSDGQYDLLYTELLRGVAHKATNLLDMYGQE